MELCDANFPDSLLHSWAWMIDQADDREIVEYAKRSLLNALGSTQQVESFMHKFRQLGGATKADI